MQPAVADFCEQLHPRLVGVLTVQCGDRGLAEELAQEALVRAVVSWTKVARMEHPAAWVFRVAFNLARSRWRRAAAERRALQRLGPADRDGRDVADASVARIVVADAVAALPERQRAAVALRYLSGLSVAETALALGCREGTVKSLTHRAMATLRERLEVEVEPIPVLNLEVEHDA